MATPSTTSTSATTESPKLIKKAAVGDVKSSSLLNQTHFGCQHIKSLLQANREQATSIYTRLIQCLKRDDNLSSRFYKTGHGADATTDTTYLCLQCPNVNKQREKHLKGHAFSVESNNGFIFCHECKDFVYDPTFESLRTTTNSLKRKHAELEGPIEGEKRLLATNTTITPCAATGLRGLYNMGQTCFMSVILQALIHNPVIRTYYLCEGHRKEDCDREACTSCALDDMFNDYFGQEKHEGYGAVHMLQACWRAGGTLAGYSQQDAHEFLGFILNSLHAANTAEEEAVNGTSKENFAAKGNCDCIVHQTFGGLLKSTVTCSSCKNVTTAVDPFMDLSLDIRSTAVSAKKAKLKLANGTTQSKPTDTNTAPMDLAECLDRFTSTETLSSDSYHCRKCGSSQTGATKKLGLCRLPPVIPVHLKRFSHSKSSSQSSKVETRIRFPFSLDLTPYTTSSSSRSKPKDSDAKPQPSKDTTEKLPNGATKSSSDEDDSGTPPKPIFELSSVIVHKGKLDNGHYISYSRQGEDWFRFDDSMVVHVGEREVLGAEAYMLFYVVRELG